MNVTWVMIVMVCECDVGYDHGYEDYDCDGM